LEGAKKIIEFREVFKTMLADTCQYRIFCLTDGEDNAV
jgi:hypothetical protein